MSSAEGYKIVRLKNGAHSVHSLAEAETFHPGIGPAAEAEALYVRQLRLPERVRETEGEFVIWDVGLGAAANALTAIRLIASGLEQPKSMRLVSFDHTANALAFALQHAPLLDYFAGYESNAEELLHTGRARFITEKLSVQWEFSAGDFPAWLASLKPGPLRIPSPHAILFDPHSPQKNPAMWTVSVFTDLFRALDPGRPCALANFTRSTLARAAMLLGGFFVGTGHATGFKEETTMAANTLGLITEPLNHRWLERAIRSDSAEPLRGPAYSRAPLSPETLVALQAHPQFTRRD